MDIFNGAALVVFILVLVAVIYLGFTKLMGGKKKSERIEDRVFAIEDKRVTTRGLRLWVEESAFVTPEEIKAIEDGILENFEWTRKKGIHLDANGFPISGAPLELKDYVVVVLGDAMRAPLSGDWCYRLAASNYYGSEFDLADGVIDGKILVAGQMLNDTSDNYILVPDPQTATEDDLADLQRVSMYEVEHLMLRHCRPQMFLETSTHGVGQGHPLYCFD